MPDRLSIVVTYAQNREDVILDAFFPDVKRGFYVDIGANHPTDDSVTKLFYNKGWRGINVEPNTRLLSLLEKDRPRDINVGVGISDVEGTLTLREYEGWYAGLSTFSESMQKENKDVAKYRDIEVPVITLKKLFTDNKVDTIHFLKVDVEGHEYSVLAGNDWEKYRPEMICIEANHNFKDWSGLLKDAKYKKVFYDGLNEYYLAEEAAAREHEFSYVKSIIGNDIVDEKVDNHLNLLSAKIEQQAGEIASYKSEVLRLNREIIDLKRVVPLMKQLFRSVDAGLRRKIERLNERKDLVIAESQVDVYSEGLSLPELLARVRSYDFDVYYSVAWQKDRTAYRLINGMYDAVSRASFAAGKKLFGLARRIRR